VNDVELWPYLASSLLSVSGEIASISRIISVYFSHSLVNFVSSIENTNIADVIDPIPTTRHPSISKSVRESCKSSKSTRAIPSTERFATNVKVFRLLFKWSLFFLDTVRLGTSDMWAIYTAAHPMLYTEGKKI